jgi:hypothetical protein
MSDSPKPPATLSSDQENSPDPVEFFRVSHRPKRAGLVQQMVIMGNVCVGKTSLFDNLCAHSEHAVNVPGSTVKTKRGVLARGPGGASRSLRGRCATCASGGKLLKRRERACWDGPDGVESSDGCPALQGKGAQPGDGLGTPLITHLYDTPGSATVAANSEDEFVARDLLLGGRMDGVLFVADAKNLRRSLAFALEVAGFGLPMVLALNMLDESENMGIEVDDTALSKE